VARQRKPLSTKRVHPGRRSPHTAAGRANGRRFALLPFIALVLSACTAGPGPLPAVAEPSPTPAAAITFPRDAGPHQALMEWWYYTGHLIAPGSGQAYGFEFVIFQVVREGQPTGYLAHFAISDIAAQRFSHQARLTQTAAPATGFPLNVDGWTLDHRGGQDTLQASMQPGPGADPAYGLQLQLDDAGKPPALHGGDGYITLAPLGGSYYYSRTRLNVSGSLTLPDETPTSVSGQAWMDHQWGNFVVSARGGWDWYSLQLDDNTEVMLYVVRTPSGDTSAVYGSYVLADGTVQNLPANAVSVSPDGTWTSPHTGASYPSGWQLTLPDGRHLTLAPQLQDQELYFPETPGLLAYWEGAVSVSGDATGQGYVELTGYSHGG
jgi:predicted secreted hydrolase